MEEKGVAHRFSIALTCPERVLCQGGEEGEREREGGDAWRESEAMKSARRGGKGGRGARRLRVGGEEGGKEIRRESRV
eukprot:194413-Rhodomonas_salina.1